MTPEMTPEGKIILIIIPFIIIAFIATFLIFVKKRRDAIINSSEKIDYLSQIKAIIAKVTENSYTYEIIAAQTLQNTTDMLKEGLKDDAIRLLTGYRHFSHYESTSFFIIFGNDEMYFVPYEFGKEINVEYDARIRITHNDIKKLKINKTADEIKIALKNKSSFYFNTRELYYCNILSQESFKTFILALSQKINN
ncbi:hypothetical protein [Clostridium weizhouense]|uniref:DUF4230 domain-containing protein n=1 Tax=Clostridium weizhouense TaxID=2859781 RepID=A0ABS7ANB6_9CLOT|nr:hypothetical protein [Clostridium weizhouense]MBW6410162.1 hypothetical protein [Clostridium weizhouense]